MGQGMTKYEELGLYFFEIAKKLYASNAFTFPKTRFFHILFGFLKITKFLGN